MRPIDADRLHSVLENIANHLLGTESEAESGIAHVIEYAMEVVRAQPTIAPLPNDPLTLDELREMDGEPVWLERPGYEKGWALVQVWAKLTNVIYLIQPNGLVLYPQVELDCGGKVYRRKRTII